MSKDEQQDILNVMQQEAAGGGGLVAQAVLYGAYNVFASLPPAERIFTFSDADGKVKAKAKADKLSADTSAKLETTAALVIFKDTVLGRDVSHWQGDRIITYGPPFGADYQELNKLRGELMVAVNKKFWGRFGSTESPNAAANSERAWAWEDDPNNTGEKRLKRMLIPVEVYPSREAAEQAIVEMGGEEADPSFPGGGWSPANWNEMKPIIAAEYRELVETGTPKAAAIAKLAKEYTAGKNHIELVVG